VVLTRRAHQMFLWTSGALWEIQTAASRAENSNGNLDGLFGAVVPDALEGASSNLVAVVVTASVVAMVAFQVFIR
jgi:hypothetical protein